MGFLVPDFVLSAAGIDPGPVASRYLIAIAQLNNALRSTPCGLLGTGLPGAPRHLLVGF